LVMATVFCKAGPHPRGPPGVYLEERDVDVIEVAVAPRCIAGGVLVNIPPDCVVDAVGSPNVIAYLIAESPVGGIDVQGQAIVVVGAVAHPVNRQPKPGLDVAAGLRDVGRHATEVVIARGGPAAPGTSVASVVTATRIRSRR
jgi:hypothetical protein